MQEEIRLWDQEYQVSIVLICVKTLETTARPALRSLMFFYSTSARPWVASDLKGQIIRFS